MHVGSFGSKFQFQHLSLCRNATRGTRKLIEQVFQTSTFSSSFFRTPLISDSNLPIIDSKHSVSERNRLHSIRIQFHASTNGVQIRLKPYAQANIYLSTRSRELTQRYTNYYAAQVTYSYLLLLDIYDIYVMRIGAIGFCEFEYHNNVQ